MNNTIFIPNKINIGFQNRNDTYTKKLAYIIYFDEKGKLRKETSWNSWRDNEIPNIIFENKPTEGFVLNKKVGDYCCDWNHRQAYVRVYDPRDFEFEITIENLLYILENTSSIKGKGLEGEFVYGWNGKDLILMPISSPDYKQISNYTNLLLENKKIKTKDLIIGATYRTKQNEEWIYIGKYDEYSDKWSRIDGEYKSTPMIKNKFWFYNGVYYDGSPRFERISSISNKFIDCIDNKCCDNYADLFDSIEHNGYYSPYDETKDKYIKYTISECKERLSNDRYYWGEDFFTDIKDKNSKIKIRLKDNIIEEYIKVEKTRERRNYNYWRTEDTYIETYMDEEWVSTNKSLEEYLGTHELYYINLYLKNGKFYRKEEA